MEQTSHQDISIIDKDESTEKSCHVVDGFVIEDSKHPFPVSIGLVSPNSYCSFACLPLAITNRMGSFPLFLKSMGSRSYCLSHRLPCKGLLRPNLEPVSAAAGREL